MLNWIKEFLGAFWSQAQEVLTWFLSSLLDLILSVPYAILDVILTGFESLVGLVDLSVLTNLGAFTGWNLLPPQLIYILDAMNIGTCLAILSGAYAARLLLNLIPGAFTRV